MRLADGYLWKVYVAGQRFSEHETQEQALEMIAEAVNLGAIQRLDVILTGPIPLVFNVNVTVKVAQ